MTKPVQFVWESPLMRLVPRRFVAMTLGHTIHVRADYLPPRTVRHELKHVEQFQRYGFWGFIARYLYQCARYGYRDAPLEIEAQDAEWETDPQPARLSGGAT